MNFKHFITGITLVAAIIMGDNQVKAQGIYPERPEDISPLLIGEQIPEVKLVDAMAKTFDLNKAIASQPTILIFYRGGWCPYCNLELSGLQEIEGELRKTGYQIIAVSTDKPDNLKQSMEKGKLSYTLLSDADLNFSKQMGIAFKAPEAYHKMLFKTTDQKNTDMLLPVPSVFILNKKGEIRFEYIEPNFRERISPGLLKVVTSTLYKDLLK